MDGYIYEELLERAHHGPATGQGGLSAEGVAALARRLGQTTPSWERYRLLKIFGYIGDISYRHIIERFLAGPDPRTAEWALFVLCCQWGLTGQYIEPILTFMRGVPWDDEPGIIQDRAFSCANEYLIKHPAPKLLRELIRIAEADDSQENESERAYNVLANLVAGSLADPAMVLHQAEARLKKEEADSVHTSEQELPEDRD